MTKALSRRRPVFLERAQGGVAQPDGIPLALFRDADDLARDEFGDLVGAVVQLQLAQGVVEGRRHGGEIVRPERRVGA
jgi:hypothetical protein